MIKDYSLTQKRKIEISVIYSFALLASIVSVITLYVLGYSITSLLDGTFKPNNQYIYMFPLFFIYGILIGQIFYEFLEFRFNYYIFIFGLEIFFISFIAYLRISIWIPISGHAVIISYYLLLYILYFRNNYILRTLIGILVFLYTIYVKYFVNDFFTLTTGIVLGSLVFFLGYFPKSKYVYTSSETDLSTKR